jgi:hypothetical protein
MAWRPSSAAGYYVLVFDCAEQDFQGFFQRFFNDPGIRGFLEKLRPFVEGLPEPHVRFAPGDAAHAGDYPAAAQLSGGTVTSAQLPFAASAYHWSAADGRP